MELNEFVSQAITQIIDGVKEAQEHANVKGALVAPGLSTKVALKSGYVYDINFSWVEHNIDFDVAITTSEGMEGRVGAGIFVAGITLGGSGKGEMYNQTISRLKFSVPIYLPYQSRVTI